MLKSSPFKTSSNSVSRLMQTVALATLPGALALFYFFGWGVIFNLITCISVALLCEAAVLKLRQRPIKRNLMDYSALLTAVLLALSATGALVDSHHWHIIRHRICQTPVWRAGLQSI